MKLPALLLALFLGCSKLVGATAAATPTPAPSATSAPAALATVLFTGEAESSIASGVAIPAGRALFMTSGITATVIKKDATSVYERIGDTYVQGVSVLKNIETVLAKQGLTMKDVVFLRVFVAPDAFKGGKPDFPSWFRAYGEFFNNASNPAKTARSTVGVSALVNPDLLIEVEAVAVYPTKK